MSTVTDTENQFLCNMENSCQEISAWHTATIQIMGSKAPLWKLKGTSQAIWSKAQALFLSPLALIGAFQIPAPLSEGKGFITSSSDTVQGTHPMVTHLFLSQTSSFLCNAQQRSNFHPCNWFLVPEQWCPAGRSKKLVEGNLGWRSSPHQGRVPGEWLFIHI